MQVTPAARVRTLLMSGISWTAIALMAASPALAQQANPQASDSVEAVTVTGTLLKGTAPIGAHVVGVSTDDIKATGAITTNEVLSNVPQINSLFNTAPITATAGVGHDTQPKPILRNLNSAGGAATLVMVDGHNLVGDGVLATTPDPTAIPAMVLQRVDVVLDGGSSIYGSNAIAGIINLITRKDFEGFQAQTQLGTTTAGNYNTIEAGFMAGHNWGSGGAYIAYEYRYNSYQYASDRAYPRQNLIPLGGTTDQRSSNCDLANITIGSTIYHQTTSAVANAPGALAASVAPGVNKCDTTFLGSTPFPQDAQHSFFASLHQEITDDITFSLTANYSRHNTTGLAYALGGSGTITNANPYFQRIGTETSQTVAFSLEPAFGAHVANTDQLEKFYVAPDLDFKFGKDWDLDVLGNYGRSSIYQLSPSLNAVQLAANLQSSSPTFALDPYNLNLSNGAVLQQLQNFGTTAVSTQELAQARAIANGSLFHLPGGDVKVALGAQYDYETLRASNVNGPLGQRGGTAVPGGLVVQADVHRDIDSLFGEINVPIVGSDNELPFVHSLALDVSARYDHYSDVGDTKNPKIGITYEPIAGLKLNGNIGTSFNAPSMADKQGATETRVLLQQPPGNPVPGVAVPAGNVGFLIAGGSPDLQSQTAHTWSTGFDYAPDWLNGLDLNLTYWHVSLYNVIAQAPYKTTQMYTIPAYSPYYILFPTQAQLNAATAGIVQAGFPGYAPYYDGSLGTGVYTLLDARRHNLGNVYDEGLDFAVNYALPTDFGDVEFGVAGSDYTLSDTRAFAGASLIDQLMANTSPYNFSAHIGGTMGAFTARVTWNYSAGYTSTTTAGQTHIGAFGPVNLYASYDLSDLAHYLNNATIGINVNNLFDVDPPFANNTTGGTANGSTLGRFVEFNLSKKF
jgi:iron complex outermembrane receptor protein